MLRTSRAKRAKEARSKRQSESRSRGAAGGQIMDAMPSCNTCTIPCREHGRWSFPKHGRCFCSESWTLPFSKHGCCSLWPHGRCFSSSHGRCRMSCILLYNNANTVCGGRRRSRPSMTGECAVIKEAMRYKATKGDVGVVDDVVLLRNRHFDCRGQTASNGGEKRAI